MEAGAIGEAKLGPTKNGEHELHFIAVGCGEHFMSCMNSHVMFSLRAARHCHSFQVLQRPLACLRTPLIRHASLKALARPQPKLQQLMPAVRRSVGTQSAATAATKARLNKGECQAFLFHLMTNH